MTYNNVDFNATILASPYSLYVDDLKNVQSYPVV